MKTRLYDLTLLAIVTIRSRSVLLPDFLPTRSQAEIGLPSFLSPRHSSGERILTAAAVSAHSHFVTHEGALVFAETSPDRP